MGSSCVTLYKPNSINTPLLKEKGEANVGFALGITGNGLANLQSSYAFSENAALMLNGMYHSRSNDSVNSGATGNERLNIFNGELGLGYFQNLGEAKKGLFQFYGGVGAGHASNKIINYANAPYVNANYANAFIQPGIAFTDKYFDFSFDVRANFVQMFNVNGYLYTQFEWWNTDFVLSKDTAFNFMNIEPAITFRVGDNRLKGFFQLGAIIPVYNAENYFAVNSASYLLLPLIKTSIGVNYTIGRK